MLRMSCTYKYKVPYKLCLRITLVQIGIHRRWQKMAFDKDTLLPPASSITRRVGHPRTNWTIVTVEEYWHEIGQGFDRSYRYTILDHFNPAHIQLIFHAAQQGFIVFTDAPPRGPPLG